MQNNVINHNSPIPIPRQLADKLINEIVSDKFKINDKFYTEKELREKYQISTWAAREAVNELVFRDLVYRIPHKGTFVKRLDLYNTAVNTSLNNNVFLYLSDILIGDPRSHSFFSDVYMEMETKALKTKHYIEIYALTGEEKIEILFNRIAHKSIRGILAMGPSLEKSLLQRIAGTGIPTILIDSPSIAENVRNIGIDNMEGTSEAIKHFVDNGHRKIGFVGKMFSNRNITERYEGYKKALETFDIDYSDDFVCYEENPHTDLCKACEKFLRPESRPTAIFCASDEIAEEVVRLFNNNNIGIPDDVSIIGFNDSIASELTPPISTMRVDRKKMSSIAIEIMIDLSNKRNIGEKAIYLKPEFIDRKTVKNISRVS